MSKLQRVLPKNIKSRRRTKQILTSFAERYGFVYFGRVDQHEDEYQLVRGLTLSPHHRDNHYTVGTFEGYDIAMLERVDTLEFPNKPAEEQYWFIMQFDLHSNVDIPHVFLGLHNHSPMFYAHILTKFSALQKAPLGTFGMYDAAFTDKYAIYTTPAEALTIERLFDAEMTSLIAKHFGTLTVEIADGSLYLYSSHKRLTKQLLETMLHNGVWLARHIDERAPRI